ncbi:alpha/beta hydrolase [Streptomyces sp. NPDC002004]
MRFGSARLRRTLLAALVVAAVAVPVSAAGRPGVPAPAPAHLAADASPASRYLANRADAARAAGMARAHGDRSRAAHLRAMAAPARHLLAFDARGAGQAVEVFGDLTTAHRVAVLVPGSDTSLDTYARFRAGAIALRHRVGPDTAVVAWLGYRTPGTVSREVLTTGRADEAVPRLLAFLRQLRALNPGARMSLLCHSYGSVVCGRAAPGLDAAGGVGDLVLFGSPGTGADSVAGLRTHARVWAGRGGGDWIAEVPHTQADLFGVTVGFGTDPVSRHFGARVFAAGPGSHSDYLKPGAVSLANIARIVLGQDQEVTSHD